MRLVFRAFKAKLSEILCSSLYELATVVDTSTVRGVNVTLLWSLHDGSTIVPVYDWVSFLSLYFKKFPNIKKYHHFQFKQAMPGVLMYREFSDGTDEHFSLLKIPFRPASLLLPYSPKVWISKGNNTSIQKFDSFAKKVQRILLLPNHRLTISEHFF